MKTLSSLVILVLLLGNTAFATLTPGKTPVTKTGGSTPQLQDGSIFDTGTASGAGNVGISTINPIHKFEVKAGGTATELVNKEYELIMTQPTAFTISGAENEVQGFAQYKNNLYIGYQTETSNSFFDISALYKWDGNTETLFYTLGIGNDFSGINAIQPYQGNLYIGNQAGLNGSFTGCVYVYNPNATVGNFVQMPGNLSNTSATSGRVTVPNDSTNNAIFGATSYSVEYYGRIDDLGNSSAGKILNKLGSSHGWELKLGSSNKIVAGIFDSVERLTTTNNNVFTFPAYHDIIMSWTSGSAIVIYVDGVSAGIASSTAITTPSNDTANSIFMGNLNGGTFGSGSFGGTFKRVRIWRNYAVSSGDAVTLAAGGTIGNAPTGQYLFTEGTGTTTADSSGNGNTATIVSPAFWNTNLFDISYCSGVDKFIYSMAVFKGKLYAGAGFSLATIYGYDGTTWSTAYAGLSGTTLLNDLHVYKGRLFASASGSAGNNDAILSSLDGVTWTTETLFPYTTYTGITRFQEFKGKLYVGTIAGASGTNDLLVRNDATGAWTVAYTFPTGGQTWGISTYNNALYTGITSNTGTGALIYKSYDGNSFVLDYQIALGALGHEAFNMYNYNGSLYIALGYQGSTTAEVWRKTDSVGQQSDWAYNFINKLRNNTANGYNWPDDQSLISVTTPWSFDSNVGVGSTNPQQSLDVQGTVRITGFNMPTSASNNYVLTSDASGNGTWQPSGGASAALWVTGNIGINTTSNVGIGSTAPQANLDINATSPILRVVSPSGSPIVIIDGAAGAANRDLRFASAGVTRWIFREVGDTESGSNVGSSFVFDRRADNGSDLGAIFSMERSSGSIDIIRNLGIGTNIPLQKLSVVGNVGIGSVSGDAYVTTISPTGGALIFGNVGIGSLAPGTKLDVTGTVRATGVFVGAQAVCQANGTNCPAAGAGTVTSVTLASPNSTLSLGGTNPVTSSGTINVDLNLTTANTWTGQQIFNTANVGVGSATPGQKVDVQGTVRATAFIGDGSGLTGLSSSQWATQNTTDVSLAGGNVGIGTTFTTTAALGVLNGNVGIGTWKPGKLLQVGNGTTPSVTIDNSGNLVVAGVATLTGNTLTFASNSTTQLINSSNAAGSTLFLTGGAGTTSVLDMKSTSGVGTADFIRLRVGNAGGTEALRIISSGNVGIGTVNPPQTLSISGVIGFKQNAPTISSCGSTPSGSVVGNDAQGTITVGGTATACTLAFIGTYAKAPHCIISNQSMSVTNAMTYTESTSGFVISQAVGLSGDLVDYHCSFDN